MATQVDLGKIRPVWKGDWAASTAYEQNDMVKVGVDSYICTAAHTSGSTFADTNWDILAVGAEIPSQTGYAGKALVTDGTNLSWGDGGKVLQVKTVSANYDWGSIGHSNDWNASWLNITLTAQANDSKFLIMTNLPTDDTNSSSYGVGAGVLLYRNSDGANWWIKHAAHHDDYTSSGGDSYTVARDHFVWDSSVTTGGMPSGQITAGTSYDFRPYFRFNNGNAQYFNSNDSNYHNQWFSVWEVL